jgi:AcrR family transcriptional regulator
MPSAERSLSTPKRDHLMATALRLFYRDGYRAVGIDTILAESKLAKMTLYHHFASKEDLIVAALDWRAEQARAALLSKLEKAGASPKARYQALFDHYEAWFREPGFNGCFFIRAVAEYPELRSKIHQAAVRQKQGQLALYESLLSDLGVRKPASAARQLYQIVEGAIVAAHTFGDPESAAVARKSALQLLEAA